jgi:hypothetical protein
MENRPIWAIATTVREVEQCSTTGALRVSSEDGQRLVFFEEGAAVYFVSECAEDSLEAFLGRSRLFASEEAGERLRALGAQATRSKPLVSLLLEEGHCEADDLRPLLTEHLVECFGRLIERREAVARFLPNVRASHPLPFRLAAARLLVEAARCARDIAAVRSALGPLTWLTAPGEDHAARLERAPLGYVEGAVGARVTDEISLEDLLALCGLPEEGALRALLALRLVGVLEPFTAPRALTDTGRLRRRVEALEAGVAVDLEAAALVCDAFAAPDDKVAPGVLDEALAPEPLASAPRRATPVEAGPTAVPHEVPGASGRLRMIASVYVQLAQAEVDKGNANGAIRYYRTALAQKPNDLQTLLAFAEFMRSMPDGQLVAEGLLKQACDAHPKSVTARLSLATLYRDTGNDVGAEGLLTEVSRLDPARAPKARGVGSLVDRFRGLTGRGRVQRDRK